MHTLNEMGGSRGKSPSDQKIARDKFKNLIFVGGIFCEKNDIPNFFASPSGTHFWVWAICGPTQIISPKHAVNTINLFPKWYVMTL